MIVLRPSNDAEARDMIGWAMAENHPLEIVAGGSKRALGRPDWAGAPRPKPREVC